MRAEDALALAKSYTKKSLAGAGALKGQDGKSAYQIALDNGFVGTEQEWVESLQGADGVSPTIEPNQNNTASDYRLDITTKDSSYTTENLRGPQGDKGDVGEPAPNLIVTENEDNEEEVYRLDLNNGKEVFTTGNLIGKQGIQGDRGFSPTVTLNEDNTDEVYRLDITTDGSVFTTPNLKGAQGQKGDKGEPGESAVSAINPRGDYAADADPAYAKNDYITFTDGNTYVCKADNPTNEPPVDGSVNDPFWQIIALRGGKGEQGEPGKDGQNGAKGTTFTPQFDDSGNMSWTNDGGLENPAPINVKAYEPKIGTVKTLESTEKASVSVENDESTKKSTFNFSIPKGVAVKSIVFKTTTDASGESGKSGATDTYEITYTDGSTSEYSVYNGKDCDVQIDDETTSAETVWSSQKTSDEIKKVGGGITSTVLTFDNVAGKDVKWYKICSAINDSQSYTAQMIGQRINTTAEIEYLSLSSYSGKQYAFNRLLQQGYASTGKKPSRDEANYFVIDADWQLLLCVASYSMIRIELLRTRTSLAIDGTETTAPDMDTLVFDGYSAT